MIPVTNPYFPGREISTLMDRHTLMALTLGEHLGN